MHAMGTPGHPPAAGGCQYAGGLGTHVSCERECAGTRVNSYVCRWLAVSAWRAVLLLLPRASAGRRDRQDLGWQSGSMRQACRR